MLFAFFGKPMWSLYASREPTGGTAGAPQRFKERPTLSDGFGNNVIPPAQCPFNVTPLEYKGYQIEVSRQGLESVHLLAGLKTSPCPIAAIKD